MTVATGFPHYPVGRTYPGYRVGRGRREMIAGIPVIRMFEYPYHGKSVIGRVAKPFRASTRPSMPRDCFVRRPYSSRWSETAVTGLGCRNEFVPRHEHCASLATTKFRTCRRR